MPSVIKILTSSAQNNIFFQDFLTFLRESEKVPFELVNTGTDNVKVKEIKRLGEAFQHDIYHRDNEGNIMFAIRTEDDFPYISWMKQLAKVMNLTFTRNKKIKLSKHGKIFLMTLDPAIQYQEMVKAYLLKSDWRYINLHRAEAVSKLQDHQLSIWRLLLEDTIQYIEAKSFYETITVNLLKNRKQKSILEHMDENDSYKWVIEKAIVRMLRTFGLIDTEETPSQYGGNDIVGFRLNQSGVIILEKIVREFV